MSAVLHAFSSTQVAHVPAAAFNRAGLAQQATDVECQIRPGENYYCGKTMRVLRTCAHQQPSSIIILIVEKPTAARITKSASDGSITTSALPS